MYPLSASQYASILPLFHPLDYHLTVRATLCGAFPAPVYADDPAQARLAAIWAGKRLYIAGEGPDPVTTGALGRLILERIYPEALARKYEVLIFQYPTEKWAAALTEILAGKRVVQAAREQYTFRSLPPAWQKQVPAGLGLQAVDADLIGRRDLKHMDGLIAEIENEGQPVEHFLHNRFGVCAIFGDEIAGWCLSEYNLGERCEIGIETLEAYQRRGLGLAMTCALVEMALQRGVTQIGWDCYRNNLPSSATARKAGFDPAVAYETSICWVGKEVDS